MDTGREREWAPRIWEGMDYFGWLRLLTQGRGRVGFPYWYIAGIVSNLAFVNTLFRWIQEARYGKQIDAVTIEPPIFVLGHWRTGTSLLHELLTLDDRHTTPLTFHCFEPCHCVLSETLFRKHLKFLLPGKRPMDNMPAGWDVPQEDEFALALLGQPTTYHEIAWPNEPGDASVLDLSSLSARQLQDWKRVFVRFLKAVLFMDQRETGRSRRLVLKSPPHTARIPTLLELFPDAKFVYLRRDPYVVYASTLNLWQSFAKKHGLQTPSRPDLIEAKVLREYRILIQRYEATKHLIPPGRLIELSYEEFTRDLLGGMQRVYECLSLGNWDAVKPKLEANAAMRRSYTTNKYTISDADRVRVDKQWGDLNCDRSRS